MFSFFPSINSYRKCISNAFYHNSKYSISKLFFVKWRIKYKQYFCSKLSINWLFFFFSVLLEFSIEEYLDRYNKRGIKPFQEINETERLNITKPISTTKRKLFKNERKKIPYQLQSVTRFSTFDIITMIIFSRTIS